MKMSNSFFSSYIKIGGANIKSRSNASITLVDDDQIYIFGGYDFYSESVFNDVYLYNAESRLWVEVKQILGLPPSKRNDHSASYWDNKLIIFGGNNELDEYCNDVILLNLTPPLAWERPEIKGTLPNIRGKHSAVVHKDKLYITGGSVRTKDDSDMDECLSDLNILDLKTFTWQEPIPFLPRCLHYSWVYNNRLYVYGGFTDDLERKTVVSYIDLIDYSIHECKSPLDDGPTSLGNHFAQICGHLLVVIITRCFKNDASDVSTGVWTFDLNSYRWVKHEDTFSFEGGNWSYFASRPNCTKMYLLGSDQEESIGDYLGTLCCVDLEMYGIVYVPPSDIGADLGRIFNKPDYSDYLIFSNDEKKPIYTHQLILSCRWPYFSNMKRSGCKESIENQFTIPESYKTVHSFIRYLYTDSISSLSFHTVSELLILSNMYLVPRLQKLCCNFLLRHITIDTVGRILYVSHVSGERGLHGTCLRFIYENFGRVVKTVEWNRLPAEALHQFFNEIDLSAKVVEDTYSLPFNSEDNDEIEIDEDEI